MAAWPMFNLFFDEEGKSEAAKPPPEKKARFATCDEKELAEIVKGRVPKGTEETTDKWLRVVTQYMGEKKVRNDLETILKKDLDSFLERLYVELRRKDRTHYSKTSLMGCRAAINCHQRSLERRMDLFRDEEFSKINRVLDSLLKKMKRDRLSKPVEPKKAIQEENDDLFRN